MSASENASPGTSPKRGREKDCSFSPPRFGEGRGEGFWIIVGCVALTSLAGCARPREFAEVEGVVTMNGKPLEAIEVLFLPDPEHGNAGNTSIGLTDKQGRYRIHNDRDQKDGTVLGMHRVLLIDSYANTDPAGLANKPSRIPTHYAEAGSTPLRNVEIKPGKQQLDFEIKGKGP